MHKTKFLIILLLALRLPLFCEIPQLHVNNWKNDREIENAYMTLFSKEFGYTLIGEKPVSMDEGIENEYLSTQPDLLEMFYKSLQKTFIDSKKLIFKVFLDETSFYWIEIIHRGAIKKCVLSNKKLKRFILKKYGCLDLFYKKLEDPKTKIIDILDNDAYLKGIVLGYGDSNANYFCRRCIVGKFFTKFQKTWPFFSPETQPMLSQKFLRGLSKARSYAITKPKPSPGFSSLESEWEWIEKVWWGLEQEREATPPYFVALPLYICRHGGDSEMIRAKYDRAREKLANLFCGKSFQQAVYEEANN